MDVIRLRQSEKKLAAKVFARSFFDYPLMVTIYPDRKRRARYLGWHLGCMINYGLRYGEVYTTPDTAGVAIWLPPGQTHCSTWRYILSGFLPVPFLLGFKQYGLNTRCDNILIKVHDELMPRPHWYLWAIAVDPDRQGMGVGTKLMQYGLENADAQNLPCYLETHDEKDVLFYMKRGFDVVRIQQIPGADLRFWCMLRELSKSLTGAENTSDDVDC